jgi:hypothetical protein
MLIVFLCAIMDFDLRMKCCEMVRIMLHTIVHDEDEELAIATHESAGNLKQKLSLCFQHSLVL